MDTACGGQDRDDLRLHLGREGEVVAFLRAQKSPLGNAVRTQGGADDSRGVSQISGWRKVFLRVG